jgi:hypothetical protein
VKDIMPKHGCTLPDSFYPKSSSKKINNNKSLVSYVCNSFEKEQYIKLDCCINHDFVYDYFDYTTLRCPVCNADRFQHCSKCYEKKYEDCSCDKSKYGVSKNFIYYRSILSLILKLLHKKGFRQAIQYRNIDNEEGLFGDCMNSPLARKQMEEMKINYGQWKLHNEGNNEEKDNTVIPIYLLSAIFYDSASVCKYSPIEHSFAALMFTFLNLPPNMRKKDGVGTFMPFLYTGGKNKEVEAFVFKSCFAKEMQLWCKGMVLHVDGKKYFVQCRTIMQWYDTKAAEAMLCLQQLANSLIYCPLCGLCKGENFGGLLKASTWGNIRNLLPLWHFLRNKGQSKQCCCVHVKAVDDVAEETAAKKKKRQNKRNQNKTNAAEKTISSKNSKKKLPKKNKNQIQKDNKKKVKALQHAFSQSDNPSSSDRFKAKSVLSKEDIDNLVPCDSENAEEIKNFLGACYTKFTYFHTGFKKTDFPECMVDANANADDFEYFFDGFLYFEDADYRPYKQYSRISHEEHTRKVDEAVNRGGTYQGVHGKHFFHDLPYFKWDEQIAWDPFHCLENIVKYLLNNMKGLRCMTEAVVKYCMKYGYHPSLCFETPVWSIDENIQNLVDVHMHAILLPEGYKSSYQIPTIFSRTARVKGYDLIHSYVTFVDYMLFLILRERPTGSFPLAYALYYSMWADDIGKLLAPEFTAEEVDSLYNKIVEILNLHYGVFPHSESQPCFHQVLDIVPYIKSFGCVMGWWTLPGERSLAHVKDNQPEGGKNMYLTTFKRAVEREMITLEQSFRFDLDIEGTDKFKGLCEDKKLMEGILPAANVLYHDKKKESNVDATCNSQLIYTDQMFSFYNEIDQGRDQELIGECELNELFTVVFKEQLELYYGSKSEAKERSKFYQLLKIYLDSTQHSSDPTMLFVDWLSIENNSATEKYSETISSIGRFRFFKLGYIYGMKLQSRYHHRKNDVNSLSHPETISHTWHSSLERSSWCKYRYKQGRKTVDKYGQIQLFFRVNFISEPVLNGLPVVIVMLRETQPFYRMHKTYATSLTNRSRHIIAATKMYSTPVALVGLTKLERPIVPASSEVNKKIKAGIIDNLQYESDLTNMDSILLIDLEKSRLSINYKKSRVLCLYNNMNNDRR